MLHPNAKSEVVLNPKLTGEVENVYIDRLNKIEHVSKVKCLSGNMTISVGNCTAGLKVQKEQAR